jgi:hypothetical protein
VLAEDDHPAIDEVLVLQHRQPGLGAGVAELRAQHDLGRGRVGRQRPGRGDGRDEVLAAVLLLTHVTEHRVHLHARDLRRGYVLQLEGDAGHDLVLAIHQTDVVPAGPHIDDLEVGLHVARACRGKRQRGDERQQQASGHAAIVHT